MESLKIREQASAAESMGTTRWSERTRARATLGPISQEEELGLYSKADSNWGNFILTGHLAMFGDIFGCHNMVAGRAIDI